MRRLNHQTILAFFHYWVSWRELEHALFSGVVSSLLGLKSGSTVVKLVLMTSQRAVSLPRLYSDDRFSLIIC